MTFSSTIAAVLTVAALVSATRVAVGQSDCVNQLVPCASDLNSANTPSTECCSAIRQVVTNQLPCLCNLYKNSAARAGINITQALEIPRRCNISNDISACNALAPTGSSHPPPSVRGSDNGASMESWMGMPILLLLSVVTFLY